MAGAFGYGTGSYHISMQMGNSNLLPAIRNADPDHLIIADGTSCRCQIKDGAQRTAKHVALVLDSYLKILIKTKDMCERAVSQIAIRQNQGLA